MQPKLTATADMVRQFYDLFVNRRAYTVQSMRPHPESGQHYYFRPVDRSTGRRLGLSTGVIRQHLEGDITIECTERMHGPLAGTPSSGPPDLGLGSRPATGTAHSILNERRSVSCTKSSYLCQRSSSGQRMRTRSCLIPFMSFT